MKPSSLRKDTRLFFFVLLAVTAAVRCALSVFPKYAANYPDDLLYLELAQNLWARGLPTVYESPLAFSKLLYALVIAPFYGIADGTARLAAIAVWNALLLSSALIPGWLLACEVLKGKKAVCAALVLLALAPELLFSQTFMAENLYIPLLLWGFWLAWKVFSAAGEELNWTELLKAAGLGMLCWLLFFTKEIGLAFCGAVGLVWLKTLFAGRGEKGALRTRLLRFLGFIAGAAAGFFLCGILFGFSLFSSYAGQVSTVQVASALEVHYLLYATGMLLLYFGATMFFVPAMVPMLRFRQMEEGKRNLLLLSVFYVCIVSAASAYAYTLPWELGNPDFPVYLRYLSAASFPFLLLFFSVAEEEDDRDLSEDAGGRTAALAVVGILILVFLWIPSADSLKDALSLGALTRLGSSAAAWGVKIVYAGVLAAAFLCFRRKKQWTAAVLAVLIGVLETASCVFMTADLHASSAVSEPAVIEEAAALDRFLDENEGTVLMLAEDPRDPKLLVLDSYLRHDHALVTLDGLQETMKNVPAPAWVELKDTPLPADFYHLNRKDTYDLTSVAWILLPEGADNPLLPDSYEEVPVEGLRSFRVLEPYIQYALSLRDPLRLDPEETITFYGENPSFRKFLYSGFSGTEAGFTWTDGTEVSLTFAPDASGRSLYAAELTWAMTNGPQELAVKAVRGDQAFVCAEGPAEGNRLSFTIPMEAADDSGRIHLVFEIPGAKVPGNGDERLLGIAFQALQLKEKALYEPGEPILFTAGDPVYLRYEPKGFADSEELFTWTCTNEASLTIHPDVPEPAAMNASLVWALVNGPQRLQVIAGDQVVFDREVPEENVIGFTIPKTAYDGNGDIRLKFMLPDAALPGNGDPRLLGVAFQSLTLRKQK
ncbi:MAG: hypothetical protein IKG87_12935 [Clostridia bacterium]|nr:hypothetical protein [Clostridia bacterium]